MTAATAQTFSRLGVSSSAANALYMSFTQPARSLTSRGSDRSITARLSAGLMPGGLGGCEAQLESVISSPRTHGQ